jgi:hypothetical protein
MRSLFLFALLAILAGCYTPASTINKVTLGMSEQQVVKLMGKPESVTADADAKYLNYSLSEGANWNAGVPYTIRIANDKVTSYGRDGMAAPRSNHPVVTPVIIH